MYYKKSIAILFTCMTAGLFAQSNQTAYSLDFNPQKYTVQNLELNGKTIKVRAYEHIVYVSNPVDTSLEVMNVYVPEEYFKGKKVNGYSAETAPIFFPNKIGGYMEAKPATAQQSAGPSAPFPGGFPQSAPRGDIYFHSNSFQSNKLYQLG